MGNLFSQQYQNFNNAENNNNPENNRINNNPVNNTNLDNQVKYIYI